MLCTYANPGIQGYEVSEAPKARSMKETHRALTFSRAPASSNARTTEATRSAEDAPSKKSERSWRKKLMLMGIGAPRAMLRIYVIHVPGCCHLGSAHQTDYFCACHGGSGILSWCNVAHEEVQDREV